MKDIHIHITKTPLDLVQCMELVQDSSVGGIDIFVGTVREWTRGKKVLRLEFEAYEAMAISEMEKIAKVALKEFELNAIAIHHRTGTLSVGEIPVIIATSAPHRGAAFEACRYAIDTLKQTVPIWKKEIFEDGEVWVSATP